MREHLYSPITLSSPPPLPVFSPRSIYHSSSLIDIVPTHIFIFVMPLVFRDQDVIVFSHFRVPCFFMFFTSHVWDPRFLWIELRCFGL